jgi:hypothetical protein
MQNDDKTFNRKLINLKSARASLQETRRLTTVSLISPRTERCKLHLINFKNGTMRNKIKKRNSLQNDLKKLCRLSRIIKSEQRNQSRNNETTKEDERCLMMISNSQRTSISTNELIRNEFNSYPISSIRMLR